MDSLSYSQLQLVDRALVREEECEEAVVKGRCTDMKLFLCLDHGLVVIRVVGSSSPWLELEELWVDTDEED